MRRHGVEHARTVGRHSQLAWRDELPAAALALGAVSGNRARTVGPALGGFLVNIAGPETVFLGDAASCVAVLARCQQSVEPVILLAKWLLGAMQTGFRFTRHATEFHVRRTYRGVQTIFAST